MELQHAEAPLFTTAVASGVLLGALIMKAGIRCLFMLAQKLFHRRGYFYYVGSRVGFTVLHVADTTTKQSEGCAPRAWQRRNREDKYDRQFGSDRNGGDVTGRGKLCEPVSHRPGAQLGEQGVAGGTESPTSPQWGATSGPRRLSVGRETRTTGFYKRLDDGFGLTVNGLSTNGLWLTNANVGLPPPL